MTINKKQKKQLAIILITAAVFVFAVICERLLEGNPYKRIISSVLFAAAYLIGGFSVIKKAVRSVIGKNMFDENFLMAISSVGAFVLGEEKEAVFVIFFYMVGELFEGAAVSKSRKAIKELAEKIPSSARVITNGTEKTVSPEEISKGDIISVRPGEKIPVDSVVISGSASVDTSPVTGEIMLRSVSEGDGVISGCINTDGYITLRADKSFEDSTVYKILEAVEEATAKKAKAESFITRFAGIYTPCVVFAAIVVAFVFPIFTGYSDTLVEWIKRALLFLVVSCPCALVISVPLAFFAAIGRASEYGILIKGSNYIEKAAKATVAAFDKTGTLTDGEFEIIGADEAAASRADILKIAASLERYSNHPAARAVLRSTDEKSVNFSDFKEEAGFGVSARSGNDIYLCGNKKLMDRHGVKCKDYPENSAVIYVAENKDLLGVIRIGDKVKKNAKDALDELRKSGIKSVLLTGDNEYAANAVKDAAGLDEAYFSLLPDEKADIIKNLKKTASVIYVGDGINDAPSIAESDVGAAMGAAGSAAAIETADVVIMNDDIGKINSFLRLSKKTMRIVRANIIFSIAVKILIMILAAAGYADMYMAAFGDVGVLIIAVINSIRIMREKIR